MIGAGFSVEQKKNTHIKLLYIVQIVQNLKRKNTISKRFFDIFSETDRLLWVDETSSRMYLLLLF